MGARFVENMTRVRRTVRGPRAAGLWAGGLEVWPAFRGMRGIQLMLVWYSAPQLKWSSLRSDIFPGYGRIFKNC